MILSAGTSGSRLGSFIDKGVVPPLRPSFSVVSSAATKAALRRSHMRLSSAHAGRDALAVAREAKMAYVLVLVLERRNLRATLLDVQQSSSLLTLSIKLRGSRPGSDAAQKLVSAVQRAVPADVQAPTNSQVNSSMPAAGVSSGLEPTTGGVASLGDAAAPSEETQGVSTEITAAAAAHAPGWRPALRLEAGLLLMQRTASLNSPQVQLPCYCGGNRDTNPFFAGGVFTGEFYPMAWNGNGESVLEGLGVFVQGGAARVSSYVANGELTTNTVLDIRGGVAFRYVWWASSLAPDITANVGMSYFSFPLPGSSFPSLTYTAPYLGANLTVPLGTEQVAILAGGGYAPLLAGKQTTALGVQQAGTGFEAKAGLRVTWDMFEISALYRLWLYSANYKDATVEVSGASQTTSLALKDNLNQFSLSFGMHF